MNAIILPIPNVSVMLYIGTPKHARQRACCTVRSKVHFDHRFVRMAGWGAGAPLTLVGR